MIESLSNDTLLVAFQVRGRSHCFIICQTLRPPPALASRCWATYA